MLQANVSPLFQQILALITVTLMSTTHSACSAHIQHKLLLYEEKKWTCPSLTNPNGHGNWLKIYDEFIYCISK